MNNTRYNKEVVVKRNHFAVRFVQGQNAGNHAGGKGDKWQEQVIDIGQVFPQMSSPITKVQVRFRATTGTAYDSDIGIDDFKVTGNATPIAARDAAADEKGGRPAGRPWNMRI